MTDDTTRHIALSRGKLVSLTLMGLVMVAGGLWLATADEQVVRHGGTLSDAQLGHVSGIVAVVFFGACVLYGLRKLFDRRPGLVLSADGLLDNSSAVGAGFVPWHEVTEFRIWQLKGQRVLVVCVQDVEKYIRRSNRLMRMAHRANVAMCGSPIVISSNALKIAFDELVPLVSSYHARHAEAAPA